MITIRAVSNRGVAAQGADYVQGRVEHFLAWTRELSNVSLLLANDAEHYVHYDDPRLVAKGVRRVVSEAAKVPAE